MTLNGYIASLLGVYDYYRVRKTDESEQVLKAGLTTIRRYAPEFSSPDTGSYYCLKHHMIATPAYHAFHIQLFENLYDICRDEYFNIIAERMRMRSPRT